MLIERLVQNRGNMKLFRIRGLYSGLLPNICRNSIINAAELATYHEAKNYVITKFNYDPNNIFVHSMCGLFAGYMAVIVGSPIDVVKTRIMNDNSGRYSGVLNCFTKTFLTEGIFAFYNGFLANVLRIGTFNTACFIILEQCQIFTRKNILNE